MRKWVSLARNPFRIAANGFSELRNWFPQLDYRFSRISNRFPLPDYRLPRLLSRLPAQDNRLMKMDDYLSRALYWWFSELRNLSLNVFRHR